MRNRKGFFSRREFLQHSGMFAAAVAVGQPIARQIKSPTRPLLELSKLERFVDPLPIPGVVQPRSTRPSPDHPSIAVPYLRIAMKAATAKLHRDLKPTQIWGFGGSFPGPTIETRSGEGLLVDWINDLPKEHLFPIDHGVHGAESSKPDVRAVTHLHGGKVPPKSDGYPEDWLVPGKSALYFYPNQQEAAHLWYHDHAIGITRLNVYAGLFGSLFVRDSFEDGLNLPKGKYEIPISFCDRMLDSDGQLYYPVAADPESPWVPEVFGDAFLVNGKLYPYLGVEPHKYRFRLLNASNSRFFHVALSNKQEFQQIGTDMGLLPVSVPLKILTIAPGERADLILDFAGQAGEKFIMTNEGQQIMEFRVSRAPVNDESTLPKVLRPVEKIPEAASVKTRMLTLGEKDDRAGNAMMMLLNNAHWGMPVTENPTLNSVETWGFMNFTDDSHPIHLHAVRFQILDRRPFEPEYYYKDGTIRYIGPAVPPAANEAGWKDTVQAHPGMITRIITKFDGYAGRYVWHCHLLEHEDNEMMRPCEIVAP
jgi:spore coat protein A, manganese oxidase